MLPNSAERRARAEADRSACRQAIIAGSKSFYAASLLLPRTLRDDAYALYAFCRTSDDLVDIDSGGMAAIARLRERLQRVYAGRSDDTAIDRLFADVVTRHALPRALPEALIDGLESDVRGTTYETIGDVYEYAARVAGSVGAMMAVLMGARSSDLLARACDLGVAMQLTNIARDVGEDAALGRLYLPRAWLREEGISPEAWLAHPSFSPEIGRVVQRLLHAADELYARADDGIAGLPVRCRPAIFAARRIYHAIGDEIARCGHDSVSKRARVATGRKAALASVALVDAAAPKRRERAAPPLPQTAYLVDAVLRERAPRPSSAPDGVTGRILWVAELFATLDARSRDQHGSEVARLSRARATSS